MTVMLISHLYYCNAKILFHVFMHNRSICCTAFMYSDFFLHKYKIALSIKCTNKINYFLIYLFHN